MNTFRALLIKKSFRNDCLITLLILITLRIFSSVPTPGVSTEYFQSVLSENTTLGFLNALTGSGLSSLSVMSLSITPYITASIIMQLMGLLSKKIAEMQKGMKDERKKIQKITIALGGAAAFLESIAMAVGFGRSGLLIHYTPLWVLIVSVVWTAGAVISSIAGTYIQEKHKLNGISLILVMNILSSYPEDVRTLYGTVIENHSWAYRALYSMIICLIIFGLFAFTYAVESSEKRIVVSYSGKINGASTRTRQVSQWNVFPIKLCPGSVVPVVFASSLLSTPILIAQAFGKSDLLIIRILNSSCWFDKDQPICSIGVLLYILMIYGFSYFYAEVTVNPLEIADQMKKSGGYIPGIRPGKPTEKYLRSQMKGVIALGALALIIIALIPVIFGQIWNLPRLSFMGTSIIITVGVITETRRSIKANTKDVVYMTSYKKKRKGLFYA